MSLGKKLELTWVGKGKEYNLEPRILLYDEEKSYGDQNTQNKLIHGDNLLALKALEQEYAGQVKCIYIDPPYNIKVANPYYKDFLEHSEWLDLMFPRLFLLKKLLSDKGLIFIQIDDRELAYLTLLCDEVFDKNNFIACLPTIMNLKGNQDQLGFAGTHEYILVYAKDKNIVSLNEFNIEDDELDDWEEDEVGYYKKGANLKATGVNAPRSKRPNLFFPIYITKTNDFSVERTDKTDIEVFPITKDDEMSWRWSKEKFKKSKNDVIVSLNDGSVSLYKKQRPSLGDLPSKKPKSLFYKPEYSSGNGTAQMKLLFNEKSFSYPKPEDLLKDIIHIASNPGDLVLDSFLGSGTTAAVAHKMGRRYIGIELGDHCYTHAKVRLDKVIDGEQGGISKSVGWLTGGGGYHFYELAPSLLKKDHRNQWVIDIDKYNPDMLAAAMAKLHGYKYSPDSSQFFKQGISNSNQFIFTTTNHLNVDILDEIARDIKDDESLLICAPSFDVNISKRYEKISIKKIPQSVLNKCEFQKDNYNLNIIDVSNITNDDLED